MTKRNLVRNLVVIVCLIVSSFAPGKSKCQNYITLNDLCTYSINANLNDDEFENFATSKGYHHLHNAVYVDDYNDTLRRYLNINDNNRLVVVYSFKLTPDASGFYKREVRDTINTCYFLFKDSNSVTYQSIDGRFDIYLIKKADGIRKLLVHELKKGDPSKAHTLLANKIEINSYTTYSNIIFQKGDKVYLKATGNITFGPFAGSGGPNGIDGFELYSYNRAFKHGALIGKIGADGNWFLIGSYKAFTSDASGKLFISVNDGDPSNNTGRFYLEYGINNEITPD